MIVNPLFFALPQIKSMAGFASTNTFIFFSDWRPGHQFCSFYFTPIFCAA